MDHNDREQFWKTLCSLPGNDIVAEREQLFKSIKYPKLLFRYRPVSTRSLEALRTNKLYFSSANYYDDPFDTFLHIDIEAIRNEYLSAFQTPESTEAVVEGKCGYQTGLDTLVVRTVNDGHSLPAIHSRWLSESVKCPTWGVRRQR